MCYARDAGAARDGVDGKMTRVFFAAGAGIEPLLSLTRGNRGASGLVGRRKERERTRNLRSSQWRADALRGAASFTYAHNAFAVRFRTIGKTRQAWPRPASPFCDGGR
jgi:hypothetical protein